MMVSLRNLHKSLLGKKYPHGDLNPSLQAENLASWATRRWGLSYGIRPYTVLVQGRLWRTPDGLLGGYSGQPPLQFFHFSFGLLFGLGEVYKLICEL